MVLMVDITVPMVRDRARPVSMAPSPPTTMAYATAMMEPDRQSDGTEPPTAEMPMKIASSEAPMMMPVWKSPQKQANQRCHHDGAVQALPGQGVRVKPVDDRIHDCTDDCSGN